MDIIVNFAKALNVTTEYLMEYAEETDISPYKGVFVGIIKTHGKIATVFPDSNQNKRR